MTRIDILDAAYEVLGMNQSKLKADDERDYLLAGLAFNNGVMTLADYLLRYTDQPEEKSDETN